MSLVETGFYMNRLVYLVQTNQYVNSLKDILKEEILAANPLITAEELPYKITANIKGIYDFAQTIFNMPCAFIVPITVSVIPAITSQLTLKNDQGVCQTEESAARITGLISLPCSVGLCVLARPVMALLGGYTGAKLDLAASLMTVLGVCIFPYAIIQYTNAVMQAHGYAHIPVINMLLCGVAKLAVVYVLVGNPNIGILGAPIGALLAYGAIAVLNLLAIRKVVSQKPKMLSNLLRSFLPVALMGLAVYGCYWGLTRLLGEDSSRILLCGVPIVVGVAVYFLAVVKFKAITADDCKLLPKGERIAKLLKL